jgi:hypothetical protein
MLIADFAEEEFLRGKDGVRSGAADDGGQIICDNGGKIP